MDLGASIVVTTGHWIVYDDREPADSRYRLLVGGEVNDSFPTHRIYLFKSPDGVGWTKITGPGTDGSIVDEVGTDKYGEHGFNDPVVYWRPGTNDWGMYCSGYRQKPSLVGGDQPGVAPWLWDGIAPWSDKVNTNYVEALQ